jgi:hypothetical protein
MDAWNLLAKRGNLGPSATGDKSGISEGFRKARLLENFVGCVPALGPGHDEDLIAYGAPPFLMATLAARTAFAARGGQKRNQICVEVLGHERLGDGELDATAELEFHGGALVNTRILSQKFRAKLMHKALEFRQRVSLDYETRNIRRGHPDLGLRVPDSFHMIGVRHLQTMIR